MAKNITEIMHDKELGKKKKRVDQRSAEIKESVDSLLANLEPTQNPCKSRNMILYTMQAYDVPWLNLIKMLSACLNSRKLCLFLVTKS